MKLNLKISILLATALIGTTGCSAREPAAVSLTGIVYNYSDETIAFVRVNGKEVARGLDETPNGGVKGGSGMCCFILSESSQAAAIEVILWDKSKYQTTATIEKWWPDLAHYGVVHILPGRKIVMQITPSAPRPRKDLLEARQKELGLEPKITFDYWSAGPIERIDGKQ